LPPTFERISTLPGNTPSRMLRALSRIADMAPPVSKSRWKCSL
jgi:hypothetical protein